MAQKKGIIREYLECVIIALILAFFYYYLCCTVLCSRWFLNGTNLAPRPATASE